MSTEENKAAAGQSTAEVFAHHWQAYLARDLDAMMSDYSEESVVFVNVAPEPLRGLAAIRGLYAQAMEMLTSQVMSQIRITRQAVDGEIAYLVLSAGAAVPLITDTSVIRGGKIVAQTSVALIGQGS